MTRPTWVDWGVALGLLLLAMLPLGVPALDLGELRGSVPRLALVGLVVLQTVPLIVRRRSPGVVLLLVSVGFSVSQATGADTGLAGLGLLVALYSCARFLRDHPLRGAVLSLVGYAVLVAVLVDRGSPERPVDWVTFAAVLAVPWCIGLVVRQQAEKQAGREQESAARAVAQARTALARDLHDVVTHHVTGIVLQAESTVFAADGVPQDDRARALTAIGVSGRAALTELRVLLDALAPLERGIEDRAPVAADLDGLVQRLAGTGYPVSLEREDGVVLTPDSERALHAIAREGLTNAMKHAPGTAVHCRLQRDAMDTAGAVSLVLENAVAPNRSMIAGGGRGTSIMEQRAEEAGGRLWAGVIDGATYRVAVTVPGAVREPSA